MSMRNHILLDIMKQTDVQYSNILELMDEEDNSVVLADSTSHSPSSGKTSLNGDSSPPSGGRAKRRVARKTFTKGQLEGLERRFLSQTFLAKDERRQVAQDLGLTERQVMIWFQNRRGRLKRRGPADSAYSQEKLRELTGRRPYPFLYGLLASLPMPLATPHQKLPPHGYQGQPQQLLQGYQQQRQHFDLGLSHSASQPGNQHAAVKQTYGQTPPIPNQYIPGQLPYGSTYTPTGIHHNGVHCTSLEGHVQAAFRHPQPMPGPWIPHPNQIHWPTSGTNHIMSHCLQQHPSTGKAGSQNFSFPMTTLGHYFPGAGPFSVPVQTQTSPVVSPADTTSASVPRGAEQVPMGMKCRQNEQTEVSHNRLSQCDGKGTANKIPGEAHKAHDLDPCVVEIPDFLDLPDIMTSLRPASTTHRGQTPLNIAPISRHQLVL